MRLSHFALLLAYVFSAAAALPARGGELALRADPAKSEFNLELGRAGVFKGLGDDHLIRVKQYECAVRLDEASPARSQVRLTIHTASLEVADPLLSAEKRAEVQKRMQGPDVLDIARYPEITFVSRSVVAAGEDQFRIEGDLTIRDATRPIVFEIRYARQANSREVSGEARVRQTGFGIKPVSAGGGTVKVKDEMKIVFYLVLVPASH